MVVALACSDSSARSDAAAKRIPEALEIVSVPWDIQTRGALTEETILTFSDARKVVVTDRQSLREFRERLDALRPVDREKTQPTGGIRVFARLKNTDGTMERLSIPENCGSMVRNGVQCFFDGALFRWVASRLSAREKQILAEYPACSSGQ
jgi:hypothetical protein